MKLLIRVLTAAFVLFAMHSVGFANTGTVVSVVPVKSEVLSPTITVVGQVQSRNESHVSAGISGKINWIAEPGSYVKENDVLVELDAIPFRLNVRQLEAQIQRKSVEVDSLSRDLERMHQLQQNFSTSEREVDSLNSQVLVAQAELELLEIQLEQAMDELRRTKVLAPFDGVVAQRFQYRGEDVTAIQALVHLVDTSSLEVRFHAPLQYSAFAEESGSLRVQHAHGEYNLTLRNLIPVSDAKSQTFTGHLDIPELLQSQLRVGQLISVAVPASFAYEQFTVPRDALVLRNNKTKIYVLGEEDKVRSIDVQIKGGTGRFVNVTGSILKGQKVVVRGAELLREGQTVRVLSAEEFPLATL